jgi:hypothetical protein
MRNVQEARQQLSSFLLRNGYHYHRHSWMLSHQRWMADLKFDQPLHYIVLRDCIAAVEASEQRRDRLEARIIAALPEWSLAPLVETLLRHLRLERLQPLTHGLEVMALSHEALPGRRDSPWRFTASATRTGPQAGCSTAADVRFLSTILRRLVSCNANSPPLS